MLLGRIHTLTFWHVCAPKPQEEMAASWIKWGKLHRRMPTRDCCERELTDLKKKKKTACKVISCSRNKQIVNESRWIPWTLLNTWNISAALDLTSFPSYLACWMNFACQNNLPLYCKSHSNTDGDFLIAQNSATKKLFWNRPLDPHHDFCSHCFRACKCLNCRCCLYVPGWTNGFSVMKTLSRSTNSSTAYWLF